MGTVAGAGLGGACAALGVAMLTVASPATTGCTTHACDPTTADFAPATDASAAPGGFMIDENTFVTSSLVDVNPYASSTPSWIGIPGNRTLRILFPPEVAGRTPLTPTCLVANGQNPNDPSAGPDGVTFTTASGQLAEFNDLNTRLSSFDDGAAVETFGGSFFLKNATCQFEYYRCIVDFVPLDAAPSGMDDASAEAEAGAGADAGATSDGALGDAAAE
jgi:hypothetical protein